MAKKKATSWALHDETAAPKPGITAPAGDGPAKVPLSTYVPPAVRWELRETAGRLSRERGRVVSVADIVTEALEMYLAKLRG